MGCFRQVLSVRSRFHARTRSPRRREPTPPWAKPPRRDRFETFRDHARKLAREGRLISAVLKNGEALAFFLFSKGSATVPINYVLDPLHGSCYSVFGVDVEVAHSGFEGYHAHVDGKGVEGQVTFKDIFTAAQLLSNNESDWKKPIWADQVLFDMREAPRIPPQKPKSKTHLHVVEGLVDFCGRAGLSGASYDSTEDPIDLRWGLPMNFWCIDRSEDDDGQVEITMPSYGLDKSGEDLILEGKSLKPLDSLMAFVTAFSWFRSQMLPAREPLNDAEQKTLDERREKIYNNAYAALNIAHLVTPTSTFRDVMTFVKERSAKKQE